jgi:hypothetical protein
MTRTVTRPLHLNVFFLCHLGGIKSQSMNLVNYLKFINQDWHTRKAKKHEILIVVLAKSLVKLGK